MKRNTFFEVLIVFFVIAIFLLNSNVNAATVTAASPEFADVSNAIFSASSGDTVLVPSGTAVWPGTLIITKGIILQGAGQGNTSIISGFSAPTPANLANEANYLIVYRPANNTLNEPFRITGFTLDFNNKTAGIMLKNISSIIINKIRIDNNIIKNATYTGGSARAIMIYGTVYGVIDSNNFSGNFNSIDAYGADKIAWGNLDFYFGSEDCMYYEDNTFSLSNIAHASGAGGRYCARYNTYNYDMNVNLYPWFDFHGNMGATGNYGSMGGEIYGNLLISSFNRNGGIFDHRGGKAVIFSNKVISTASWSAKAREEFDDSLNPTSNPQPQRISDSYYWNNRWGANNLVKAITANTSGTPYPVSEGIDFHNHNLSFNGTTGVGCGPLTSRPATCTPGVAYWATSQSCTSIDSASVGAKPAVPLSGTLYKCTAPNTWTQYYTPYTYPHPLRAMSTTASGDSSTPATATTTPPPTTDTTTPPSTTTATPPATTTATPPPTTDTTTPPATTTVTPPPTTDTTTPPPTTATTSTPTTSTTTTTTTSPSKSKRRW